MQSFFSSALGQPNEYRAWFSDRVGLVILAKTGHAGGDLHCRPQGSSGEYNLMYHTQPQVVQVLLDMDKAELSHP